MDLRNVGLDLPVLSILEDMLEFAEPEEPEKEKEKGKSNPSRTYVRDAKAMAATPADVVEYPNRYKFIVDMPGVKAGEIKVQVENENVLVVSGERKRGKEKEKKDNDEEKEKYVMMERRVGKFMRKFTIPDNANLDKISALVQDGVLTVIVEKLPPPEPKRAKTIEVKVA